MTLTKGEWGKTPYAKTTAKNPQQAIQTILSKHEIYTCQFTMGLIDGVSAFEVRFQHKEKPYRIRLKVLDADASREELLRQIQRVMFHYLKSMLELSGIFFTPEELFFGHLELKEGTVYEVALPHLDKLDKGKVAGFLTE